MSYMKAVLLAAGRSMRMSPIADKNFIPICGKPLVIWQIEMLKQAGFKEIFIVGGNHNLKHLNDLKIKGVKIRVVEQKILDEGMAGGVLSVKKFFKDEPLFLISGNDMVEVSILKKLIKEAFSPAAGTSLEGVIAAKELKDYFPGGYLVKDRRGLIKKIIEKPGMGRQPSDLVNLVLHLHFRPQVLFEYLEKNYSKKDDRYEAALQAWISHGARFRILEHDGYWQPVKYPWHIINLFPHFLKFVKSRQPRKEKNVVLKGQIVFGKNVKIFENTVIHGPCYIGDNTVIGNNVLIRNAHIGANSLVGFGSEIARSFLGEKARLHTNYIGDSIIGNNVAFGAGAKTGNLRLDEQNIKITVKDQKIDCGFNKCGIITGDNIRAGINTSFMPGVKIGSDSFIGAGIVIAEDMLENSFVKGEFTLKAVRNKIRI